MTANFPDPTSSRTPAESSLWSREQDKAFEDALARYFDTQSEERWEKIAGAVPEKDIAEVKRHYEMLIDDIRSIESGLVPLPCYVSSDDSSDARKGPISANSQGTNAAIPTAKGTTKGDQERRKGVAWTEEEHRLFLLGLDKFGKGDWRSISRNFVISRTPTQVASHAQKYFIRLNSGNKDRRRSSIHDITTVHKGETSGAEGPITGQVNGSGNTAAAAKPEQNSSSSSSLSTVGAYGTAVAQPIVGAAAVGTPVILPPPMSQVASGTPVNIVPVSYSVTQPTMNQ